VLGAARHLAPLDVPILSFNVGGHLGFLTHDRRLLRLGDQPDALWQRLGDDHFALERRMMLEARVLRAQSRLEPDAGSGDDEAEGPHLALNDLYFRPCLDEVSPTCLLELEIDGEVVDQYRGDGLIIATPTGSTGYAMAAGGPILHPGIEAIVVNPICPMSLSSRAVVVPPRSQLCVWPLGELSRKVKLWKDGAYATVLEPGDRCLVQRSAHPALLLILDQSPSYYRALTRKLHWAGDLTAAEHSHN
jgi:NAD+ kinase